MWYRISFLLVLSFIAVIIQISFFGIFANPLINLNIVLVIMVGLMSLFDFKYVLIFFLTSGLLLDIYSGLPFGVFLIVLFTVSLVVEFLFFNFFTNRSFYSFISLGLISAILYHVLFIIVTGFLYFINVSDYFVNGHYWLVALSQIITTPLILALLFLFINKVSKSFKPNFIQT